MKFKYTITDQDYLEFYHHFLLVSDEGRKMTTRKFMFGTPLLSVVLVFIFYMMHMSKQVMVIEVVVLLVICILTYFQRVDIYMKSVAKALENKKKQGQKVYNTTGSFTFGDETLTEHQNDTQINNVMKYSDIKAIFIGNGAYYVYTNPTTALLLPFSMFGSEEKQEQMAEFLKEHTDAAWI